MEFIIIFSTILNIVLFGLLLTFIVLIYEKVRKI
jgi:hypothetical protein